MITPADASITCAECAQYLGVTPRRFHQLAVVARLRPTRRGLYRLDHFNKFIAKMRPRLPRLDTVQALDAWRASQHAKEVAA